MLGTTRAWPAGAGLLLGMVLLIAVPQAALAAEQPRTGALLARGAGYALPHGSTRVRTLQQRLRVAGGRPGPIDGRFGPLTERAVRRLQRHSGVAADGVVGPRTRGALRGTHPRPSSRLLRRGAGHGRPGGSPLVKRLQRRLRAVGASPGPVDGVYGPLTAAAVQRVQATSRIAVDGVVGPRTRTALAALVADRQSRPAARTPDESPASSPERRGSRGDQRRVSAERPAGEPAVTPVTESPAASPDEDQRPWILIALGVAGFGLVAALLARLGVTVLRRRRPSPAIIPLGKGLELEGESEDPEIGRFSGTAYAVEIPELRDSEKRARGSRFYVLDPKRKLPFWVRYAEVHTPLPPALQAHPEPWELQGALRPGAAVLGYVTVPTTYPERHAELFDQIELIESLCRRRGFRLIGVVRDEDPGEQGALERPGIAYALEQFAAERASALVVSDVTRLGQSRAEIDELLGRLSGGGVSLLTLDPELDTSTAAGKEAVRTIAAVGGEPSPATNGGRAAAKRRERARGNGDGAHRQEEAEPARAVESGR